MSYVQARRAARIHHRRRTANAIDALIVLILMALPVSKISAGDAIERIVAITCRATTRVGRSRDIASGIEGTICRTRVRADLRGLIVKAVIVVGCNEATRIGYFREPIIGVITHTGGFIVRIGELN